MMTDQQLMDLYRKANAALQKVSELKGQETATLKQLQSEYRVNSIAEARKALAKQDAALDDLDGRIQQAIEEVEEMYIRAKSE